MRGAYRMTWPVLDARVSLVDLIGAATVDLRAAVDAEGYEQAAPVQWSLVQDERGLRLRASVEVANGDDVVRRPHRRSPCGTHAAYNRHKALGEDVDAECMAAERTYQRSRNRKGRKHHTPTHLDRAATEATA